MTVFTIQLPTPGTQFDFTETVELDGVIFNLRCRWNGEAETWFIDVYDTAGDPLILNRRASVDWVLFRQNRYMTTIPTGELMIFDSTQRDEAPGENDLGDRTLLLYLDALEVAS